MHNYDEQILEHFNASRVTPAAFPLESGGGSLDVAVGGSLPEPPQRKVLVN